MKEFWELYLSTLSLVARRVSGVQEKPSHKTARGVDPNLARWEVTKAGITRLGVLLGALLLAAVFAAAVGTSVGSDGPKVVAGILLLASLWPLGGFAAIAATAALPAVVVVDFLREGKQTEEFFSSVAKWAVSIWFTSFLVVLVVGYPYYQVLWVAIPFVLATVLARAVGIAVKTPLVIGGIALAANFFAGPYFFQGSIASLREAFDTAGCQSLAEAGERLDERCMRLLQKVMEEEKEKRRRSNTRQNTGRIPPPTAKIITVVAGEGWSEEVCDFYPSLKIRERIAFTRLSSTGEYDVPDGMLVYAAMPFGRRVKFWLSIFRWEWGSWNKDWIPLSAGEVPARLRNSFPPTGGGCSRYAAWGPEGYPVTIIAEYVPVR